MKGKPAIITKVLPAVLVFAAAGLLAFVWGTNLPGGKIPLRVPAIGGDGAGDTAGASPLEKGTLTTSGGTASDLPGAWPCFRGANRDAVSSEDTPLLDTWAAGDPKPLWSVDAGEGYAGAAVLDGRVYLMDYDREAKAATPRQSAPRRDGPPPVGQGPGVVAARHRAGGGGPAHAGE